MFDIQSNITEYKRKRENIKHNEENNQLIEIGQKKSWLRTGVNTLIPLL